MKNNFPFIASKTRTISILNQYQLRAKKKFGQNFLVDLNVLGEIINSAGINKNDTVIEVGPGIGGLTEQLAINAKEVIAFEIDKTLIPVLKEVLDRYDNVNIYQEDILKADLGKFVEKTQTQSLKVVANLPYYITTSILMQFIQSSLPLTSITVMVQKEVGDRINAVPGTKNYGVLTLMIQYYMHTKSIIPVSRNSFLPAPNVESAVITLIPIAKNEKNTAKNEENFINLVKASFAHRRKTLMNNLIQYFGNTDKVKQELVIIFQKLALNLAIRGEKLSLNQFIFLSDALFSLFSLKNTRN